MNFVVYHSGFEPGKVCTGPYDPDAPAPKGSTGSSIRLKTAVSSRGRNVYAELGGTWWFMMRDPTVAARTCWASC